MNLLLINKLCLIFDKAVIAQLNLNFEESEKNFNIYYSLVNIYFKSEENFHSQLLSLIDSFFCEEHKKINYLSTKVLLN